eukprot:TRINITY_DN15352_c0_g1_i1.p1 TRINITY_DN15352_c0_g1~~TRINITY_DN15352_c0_g1_i1.p1  ORF type:complete len:323 (+),score=28.96 TRINITY_DN15352_c0_g1_i1:171-1139(+)
MEALHRRLILLEHRVFLLECCNLGDAWGLVADPDLDFTASEHNPAVCVDAALGAEHVRVDARQLCNDLPTLHSNENFPPHGASMEATVSLTSRVSGSLPPEGVTMEATAPPASHVPGDSPRQVATQRAVASQASHANVTSQGLVSAVKAALAAFSTLVGDEVEGEPVSLAASTWSVLLVLGHSGAGAIEILISLFLLLVNIVVQIACICILSTQSFLGPDFVTEIEHARLWRTSVAHLWTGLDLAGTSLASRVCQGYGALSEAYNQGALINQIDNYLALSQNPARELFETSSCLSRPSVVYSLCYCVVSCSLPGTEVRPGLP